MKKIKISIDKKGALLAFSVTLFTVFTDWLSKILVMENMQLRESVPIIKNVFHLTYITNPGAAFGSLSNARWVFMTASTVMIAALILLLLFWDDRSPVFYVSVSMVLGGGIGNMIDRIFYGEVVDFLDFRAFPEIWSWIFNLADSYVCVGVGLLMIYYIFAEIKNYKAEKEKKNARDQSAQDD